MKWTNEIPKVNGWFWHRWTSGHQWRCIEVSDGWGFGVSDEDWQLGDLDFAGQQFSDSQIPQPED